MNRMLAQNTWIGMLLHWLLWVIATSIAGIISLIAADFMIINSLSYSFFEEFEGLHGDSFLSPLVTWGSFLSICLGISLGIAQGLVLSLVYRLHNFLLWIGTCLLSVLAGALIFLISSIILGGGAGPSLFTVSVALLLAGATIGFVQSLVLRSIIREVGWWALTNGLALSTAMIIGTLIGANIAPQEIKKLPFYPLEAAVQWGVAWGVGTIVFAGITGLVLVWLMRWPVQDNVLIT